MTISGARWTALGLFCAAAAALWQATKLSRWGFDGPGPGLYPQVIATICMALALLVLALDKGDPAPVATDDDEAVARYDMAGPQERRTFHLYLLALAVLVAGSWFAGFIVTSLAVTIISMRFAEGVSWRATLITAAVIALSGVILFGWLLQVSLPEGPADLAFRALLRHGGLL
ncbi:hypothetical protein GCM10019059_24390 [Camelimonas fluminis]|uniref:Tripartite tricarboxylate transporter TctB family protein n=1 Tax=Camelimonas fluminis TaxID=1576911 RepID=A0ABV7UBX7_9HYPH|nr:tripartite tricarboxylate transporter TctB family protein [Camelimonas fluminis]GHE63950.1 hypothetical protein GCM10019059_24390 [Camelimonas fluminis]